MQLILSKLKILVKDDIVQGILDNVCHTHRCVHRDILFHHIGQGLNFSNLGECNFHNTFCIGVLVSRGVKSVCTGRWSGFDILEVVGSCALRMAGILERVRSLLTSFTLFLLGVSILFATPSIPSDQRGFHGVFLLLVVCHVSHSHHVVRQRVLSNHTTGTKIFLQG